ncbi:adenylyl-sulfate kinase [Plectonema cf. radiosum LEGE 06105]|uniref:Adenylyl-sulfate kinase n=1 Tax=Plectonema cf. radiosum LEGE 06105 TaxID=945769 RepID=A0A8J7F5J6_9CYAN|nr:tyrosine-protein kinase domain-containing protein [Plectonema radiosum]MBE9215685.1 adenylyl-sulfate kinase [Plectonema cf. radiosum LEGE 06105]
MNKIAAIAIRHWKPVILWNILVLGITTYVAATTPRVWSATTQLTIPGTNGNLDASLGILGSLRKGDSSISAPANGQLEIQKSILTSDTLIEKVLSIDPLKNDFKLPTYKSLFQVYIDENARILTVNTKSLSPELAKLRTSNLLKLYQERLKELRQQNRLSKRQFSAVELEDAKNNLLLAQQTLAQFKQSSALVDAPEQTKAIVTTIDGLTKAQLEALSLAEYNQNRVNTLSTRLGMSPNQAIRSLSLGENKDYQFIQEKLSQIKADLARERAKYTDNHPVVRELFQQQQVLLNQVQTQINQTAAGTSIDTTVSTEGQGRANLIQQLILAETEASGQQNRAEQIQSQINQLKANLDFIPSQQARLAELQRNVDVAEGVYKGLVAQVQQTNIDVFDVYPNVEILDSPRVGNKPISPKKSLMGLNAAVAGIIGSIALILLLERRNPLLSPQDLKDMKFPIVVSIPQFKGGELTWDLDDDKQVKFQRLASAISLQHLDNRHLLITSAIEGEGKTTVTLGLAKALVDLGFRVLIVDGDFIRAELTQSLSYTQQLDSTNRVIPIEPNLDLLPTAPQSGKIVKIVSQGRFQQTLASAESRAEYDYVLVDTAPVSATSATSLMTAQIPNVLFVVKQGMSFSNSVRDSLEQLMEHQAQVLGLVVNGVETADKPYKQRLEVRG